MTEVFRWFSPDYIEQARAIKKWNMIANGGKMDYSLKALELQADLVQEEGKEVFEAYAAKNLKGFVKELCDLFVVTSYMTHIEHAFKEEPVKESDLFVLTLQEGDRLPSRMLSNLSEALEERWGAAILNNVIGLLSALDISGEAVLNNVIKNNYSKFTPLRVGEGSLLYDEMSQEIQDRSNGRYLDVTWELVEDYVIYKDSKGKILKPIGYKELVI